MSYHHTQIGYFIISALLVVALFFGIMLMQAGLGAVFNVIPIVILFIMASFVSLTVSIDGEYVRIVFGYGVVRKKILLADIISAHVVTNHWYYGWGIRVWFWPYMWIFNVSGFNAVEIRLKDGRIYRIGTDEPEELERAIIQASKSMMHKNNDHIIKDNKKESMQ
ncbi:MAG: hypothetical protein COU90_02500 [Candidatus Ryanbacteria bacterium CG10_big_fil_rev_8_21_14_0_10_43_42]|uniref:DUF304 domain-containing protein n=1 Tax=Candidatus Ryanbacteria bacterium CG10_big_fil_rev_8_21_14_0_10_43_42 TaxID=1974864 RepID=A0A2M8KWL3_9BACT|nr:MAG: hypothetical protein COU90_02500 [Candidatus Ryanbacteria bacterium CG10_big_fil_rev_8_21_14_0_10_43_42]